MSNEPVQVLLVEDDEDDYRLTSELLEEIGTRPHTCEWARTYDDGLAALRSNRHDVILVDYHLGARTGVELLRAAIRTAVRAPVIMLTSQNEREIDLEAMQAGASDFLTKQNLTTSALERSIRYAIERSRAEEALHESEERFRAIADYTYDIECWIGPDGSLRWINPAIERVAGFTVAECLNMPNFPGPLVHEDDRAFVARLWAQAIHGSSGSNAPFRLRRRDGVVLWIEASWQPIYSTRGARLGHRTSMRDVTARRRIEEALETQRQQLLSIFDSINEPIYIADPETYELLYVNEAFRQHWGDGIGQPCYQALQGLNAPCEFCTNDRIFGEHVGTPYVWEFQNRSNERWYRCIDKAIRWPDGRMVRYEMAIDITDRKQMEAALGETEERYRLLAENATDMISRIDPEGMWMYVSPASAALFGYRPEELIGQNLFDFLHPDDVPAVRQHHGQMSANLQSCRLEYRMRCKDQSYAWFETTSRARRHPESGRILEIISVSRDISDRKRAELKLQHAAQHDALTGLPNRSCFLWDLQGAIEQANHDSTHNFAVFFLDFDRFKLINDSLGHHVGDQFLIEIARRLTTATALLHDLPGWDNVHCSTARLGGDEFTVLAEGVTSVDLANRFAQRLQEILSAPYNLNGHEVFSTVSIGIVFSETEYTRGEDLLRDADTAMYRAKSSGKACHVIFDRHMHEEVRAALELEKDLRHAILHKQLRLFYQPIISLDTLELYGFEALLRWQHPHHGLLAPDRFISLAEETGVIVPIGEWVVAEACRQLEEWSRRLDRSDFAVSVNLSKKQLLVGSSIERLADVIRQSGVDCRRLKLEVTESAIMEDGGMIVAGLGMLKELGVDLLMDDFGTGHSSLSRLHDFPIDAVKVDRSFVATMSNNRQLAAIMHAILTLARNLNLQVIAEGVETREQIAQLLALGCNYAQGYYFAKPLAPDDAEQFIRHPAPQMVTTEA